MGDGMEEGTLLRWLKSEGDRVEEQEDVAEIQTEKATIAVPATESGVLTKILVKEGETVPVGAPIAQLDGGDGATSGAAAAPAAPAEPAPAPAAPSAPPADLSTPPVAGIPTAPAEGGRLKASPLARKVAAEHGVDLGAIEGTGPGGRIIEADVEEALRRVPPAAPAAPAPAAPAPAGAVGGSLRPMSPIRRIIARRLLQSKQTIPHFYLSLDVDMRAAADLRAQYNQAVGGERKVSFNDLVVRAAALALVKFPTLYTQLEGESIRTPDGIHIGVAVSLEDGLVVPVVRDVPRMSLSAIGQEVRRLADRARAGQLTPAEYSGGTFTVSNLGMYDIALFQAVINPPEAAILAVGAVRETPIVENGQVVPGKQMYLTISVDHRLVDGSTAAQFLQEVQRLLQNPLSLFG